MHMVTETRQLRDGEKLTKFYNGIDWEPLFEFVRSYYGVGVEQMPTTCLKPNGRIEVNWPENLRDKCGLFGHTYREVYLQTFSSCCFHDITYDKDIVDKYLVVPQHKNGSNTIDNIIGLCTQHHDLVHKDATWQKRLAKKKTGLNKKYGALSVLNQIIPALTKELSSLFPKHFFVTNGKSTYDYRAAHGVSKDHWLDAYCIACSVLPNDTCDKTINSRVPYELKQFRRHDRRALNNENMSRVYTFNGKMVATNRHKATEQTTDSLEEFRQRCLLSLRGIVGADQIAQWDTRYGEMSGKDNAICEE